jgi:hypothetical protein
VTKYQGDRMDAILKQQEDMEIKAKRINQDLKEVGKKADNIYWLYFVGGFVFLGLLLLMILANKMIENSQDK